MEHTHAHKTYLPAAGHDWGLPFYDPLTKLLGTDKARRTLLDQAGLAPTDQVLDIGCGTGTFLVLLKRLYPSAEATGLDPDPKALARATKKAAKSCEMIRFDQGFSDKLPYADGSFDRVFSSFMLHHVPQQDREPTFREVRRVLKPGGSFHLVDFKSADASQGGRLSHLIHSSHHLKGNSPSQIIALMSQAGFTDSQKFADAALFFGQLHIAYYRAVSPAS
jgi:ubiquinone/menaquinone biosynthesis C-methylase UbiE